MRNNVDWWNEALRWIITGLVYGISIALVFFTIKGSWDFLLSFEYWVTTVTSTAFALFLRWMYADKGIASEINANDDIRSKEAGKSNLITTVNSKNLTDKLDVRIKKTNSDNKLQEYRNKCDEKINKFRQKAWYRIRRKAKLERWKAKKLFINNDEFNIDIIRIKYYKYNIDEMMSSFYKQNDGNTRYRQNKSDKILKSYRTNVFTFIGFALLKGMEVLATSFTKEDIIVLLGQITIFTLNIWSGYTLGRRFIREDYSSNLSDDYVFLKTALKEWEREAA